MVDMVQVVITSKPSLGETVWGLGSLGSMRIG
jgi:hypothetical protein